MGQPCAPDRVSRPTTNKCTKNLEVVWSIVRASSLAQPANSSARSP